GEEELRPGETVELAWTAGVGAHVIPGGGPSQPRLRPGAALPSGSVPLKQKRTATHIPGFGACLPPAALASVQRKVCLIEAAHRCRYRLFFLLPSWDCLLR